MKKVKVYGERNSGTHFITRLIQRNFIAETIPGTLADAKQSGYRDTFEKQLESLIQDECKRKLASSIKVDEYFLGNPWKTLGWKHCVPPLDIIESHPENEKILFITLTKNPYAWALSMFRRPYGNFSLQKPDDLSQFLKEPWLTANRDNCPPLLNSPIELWNLKTDGYRQLEKNHTVLRIRYEDVIDNPEKFLSTVSEHLEKKPKKFFILNKSAKEEDVGKKDFNYYHDYYLNQRWREKLSDEHIEIINQYLDPIIVEEAGYTLINTNK
ncbi:MAG: hypothetical protein GQ583_08455 [Methyloprofundus sp.]|nr:hypothetical protein [Methyloprofundus sp.]